MSTEGNNTNEADNSDLPQDGDKEEVQSVPMDKVTELQDFLDNLALKMFNALRLLPTSQTSNGDDSDNNTNKIKELAKDVIDTTKAIDSLIEGLPGLEKSESEQLEELISLQRESIEEGKQLQQAAKMAESWMKTARESLIIVSEDRLSHR